MCTTCHWRSFSSERPHLVAQFSCETEAHDCIAVSGIFSVCCAAVWLHDTHTVTIKGIVVTVQTPNVSGIIFRNGSNFSVFKRPQHTLYLTTIVWNWSTMKLTRLKFSHPVHTIAHMDLCLIGPPIVTSMI